MFRTIAYNRSKTGPKPREPEFQYRIHSGYSVIWVPSRISLKSILILSCDLHLGLPRGIIPVGLPVNILKALLCFPILNKSPAHPSLLNLITLTILCERKSFLVSHYNAISTSHFHLPCVQIFTLGCCSQIPLACFPPLTIDHLLQPYSITANFMVSYTKY